MSVRAVCLVLAAIVPATAFAQNPTSEAVTAASVTLAPSIVLPAPLRNTSADAVSIFQQNDRDSWLGQIEETRKKRDRGLLIGVGGLGGGILIASLAGSKGSVGGAVFGGLAGAAAAGYGGWTYVRAKDRLDDLDREGRAKGYVSILPTSGGVYASASFTF